MKKIISLLCMAAIIALGFSESQAQDTRFGFKGGLTYYKGTVDVDLGIISLDLESDSRIGFTGGLFIEYPLSDLFPFNPKFYTSRKIKKNLMISSILMVLMISMTIRW